RKRKGAWRGGGGKGARLDQGGPGRQGTSPPLVVLHGAFGMIDNNFGTLIPGLARKRQVIAVELQGHGRTADIDRPLRYEQMADDVAALLRALHREKADIYGYSMGGGVALQVKELDSLPQHWPEEAIRGIRAPTLVIAGDSDAIQAEHAVEIYRLRGGGAMGDLAGLPDSQLAILPGTHHVGMLERTEWLSSMVPAFLDAPVKGEQGPTPGSR